MGSSRILSPTAGEEGAPATSTPRTVPSAIEPPLLVPLLLSVPLTPLGNVVSLIAPRLCFCVTLPQASGWGSFCYQKLSFVITIHVF